MIIHSQSFGGMDAAALMANMATLIVGGNDMTRNSMSGLAKALTLWPGNGNAVR